MYTFFDTCCTIKEITINIITVVLFAVNARERWNICLICSLVTRMKLLKYKCKKKI